MYIINKEKIILDFGKNIKNSGLTEVQIAIFTNHIKNLQLHFESHKKDFHSRRGLLKIISKRRKLLFYLKKKNINRYNKLINKLDLRR